MSTPRSAIDIPTTVLGEMRILSRLAVPAAFAYLGMMAMGVVDMIMIGRLGSEAFASVALGHTIVFGTIIGGMGLVMGIDPLISQAHGAGRGEDAGRALQWGIGIGVLASVPVGVSWFLTEDILLGLGQLAHLSEQAAFYNRAQIFSIPFMFSFVALRHYLQGRGYMVAVLVVVGLANGVNVLANWVLIFGPGSFPALGIEGAGIASGMTRVFMFVTLTIVVIARDMHHGSWVPWSRDSFSLAGYRRVLHYGVPIFVQQTLEAWAFNLSLIFVGQLPRDAETAVAAHGVVIKLAAFAFMVPLGVSVATSTRVGNLIGAGDPRASQRAAWCGTGLAGGVMALSAVAFVLFREQLPLVYLSGEEAAAVISLSASILPIAAFFQIFDGIQVAGSGVLRGMGTTRPAAIFNFVGFYLLSLPLARWMAFPEFLGIPGLDLGISGIWWGLAVGLGILAVCFVVWIHLHGPQRHFGRDQA